ncbi:hypothetical protein [Simplicispira psychrophila]|uniref:hypothetical protein n=1 Tax=Simplicispira psychrophila TaxID=80882 RepID=UPI00048A07E0|nr:hypothetical protein [Simplicispira psychrophila]
MATPNYGYEKRQRELAKKKKKEEKVRAKTAPQRPDGYSPQPQDGDFQSAEIVPSAPDGEGSQPG